MPLSAKMAVFDAYRWLFGNIAGLLALAWKPLSLGLLIHLGISSVAILLLAPRLVGLSYVVFIMLGAFFAVSWHRHVLLDEERPHVGLRRAGRYAGWWMLFAVIWLSLISLGVLAAMATGSALHRVNPWTIVVTIVATYVATRLMTLLPATALDVKQSVIEA